MKHGHARKGKHTPIYGAWARMHNRCYSRNYHRFYRYGGRGIKVCRRWHSRNPRGFLNFLADMSPFPGQGYSLHRIDNDGDYTPANCKWATRREQSGNQHHPIGRTGLKGVWLSPYGKYRAVFYRDGREHHVGMFNTPQAASRAYQQAKAAWDNATKLAA
jgi:hypothetical protein